MIRAQVRRKKVLAAVATVGLLSGCTTLPGESAPEVVSSYATSPTLEEIITPKPGNPSDLMLRDFITASAQPLVNHEAARRFLTEEANERWQADGDVFVLDKMDIASDGSARQDRIRYKMRGNLIGSVGAGGAYKPMFTGYETTFDMLRVDGEWRIDNLPNAIIVDRNDFATMYQPRTVYFLNQKGTALVPDRRWVYTRQQSLPAALISLLIAGPRTELTQGVRTMLPKDATAQTRNVAAQGVSVEFTGLTSLGSAEREMLAAQVVWTLAASEVRGPYHITADGVALSEQVGEAWQVQDVSRFDPGAEVQMPLRAIIGGRLVQVTSDGTEVRRNPGWAGQNSVESVAINPQGSVFAVVTGSDEQQRSLLIGQEDGTPDVALSAQSLTRPTWGLGSDTVYTVENGRQVVRLDRRQVGTVVRSDVNMDAVTQLRDPGAAISVFRVSRDSTRAVMLINGQVFVTVIETDANGGQRLGKPVQVGNQIGDTATTVDWHPDGSLVVGTRSADSPLWSVAVDGSTTVPLPARNLSAPVVAVAVSSRVLYATDAGALMQLNLNNEDSNLSFWREVPSLQGRRAAPILGF